MQRRIFRKSALDRLASPEQLDQLIQITDLRGWLALVALSVLVAVALIWGVAGEILITVDGTGILQDVDADGTLEGIAFVPLENSQELLIGQEVRLAPLPIDVEEFGYLRGEVLAISPDVATQSDLDAVFGDRPIDLDAVALIEVRVRLLEDPNTPTGYAWTLAEGPPLPLRAGTPITLVITVDTERPISRVFG
jgi:hypothetical protein